MADTPLLGITYPNESQDPYWTTIRALFLSHDEWMQANLEDKSLIVYGGGTMTLVGSTFSWSAPIYMASKRYATKITIAASSVSVSDGEVLYVTTGTRPITNQTLTIQAGTPTTKNDIPIGYRDGSTVHITDLTLITGYELDDAYNASSGAASVVVDAGDVTWNLFGAYSHNIDLSLATDTSDGFQVYDGVSTEYFRLIRKAANAIDIESELRNIDFNASGTFTIDTVGTLIVDTDGSATFSGADVTLVADGGILAITGDGAADVDISNAGAAIDIDSATLAIDTTAGFSFDAVSASNITVSGVADLTLGARAATVTLNEVGQTTPDTTSQSIVGAINELHTQLDAESLWDRTGIVLTPQNANDTISVVASGVTAKAGNFDATATGAVTNYGVYSVASGNSARAGYFEADATGAVTNYGVYATSAGDTGISGSFVSTSVNAGTNIGVYGSAASVSGYGGSFLASGNTGRAGYFEADATGAVTNIGVYSISAGDSGLAGFFGASATGAVTNIGLQASSAGDSGTGGLFGATATGAVTNYGLKAISDGNTGIGGYFNASATGAITNYGIQATAGGDTGRAVSGIVTPGTAYSGYFTGGMFYVGSDIYTTGDIELTTGGTIRSTANGNIILDPHGTGASQFTSDIELTGLGSQITLEANTQTSGNVVSIKSTPGSSSTAKVMRLEADGGNWGSGARVLEIVSDDNQAVALTINDGASDVISLYRSGSFDVGGNLTLVGGGSIVTSANGDITILPNGTGQTIIGDAGAPDKVTGNDSFFVSGDAEIEGILYTDSTVTCAGNINLSNNIAITSTGASANYGRLTFRNTSQTVDSSMFTTGVVANYLIICEDADFSYDFAHAQQTNPTLFGQSANQSATEWWSLTHNQTNLFRGIGAGSEVVEHVTPVELADDGSFDLPDATSGFGTFQVGDSEERADISWDSSGVVDLVIASANVVNTDTDTKFCLFDNGTQVRVRNRLGAAKKVIFTYHYWTP